MPIQVNFVTKPKRNVQLAFFTIFVFDLEFDLDLEIVAILKCIMKKLKKYTTKIINLMIRDKQYYNHYILNKMEKITLKNCRSAFLLF